jgi:hypothetical protein
LVEISTVVSEEKNFFKFHPPFLEISSNGQNCSILSLKVPKFELYKHTDELFNIYYGIFYELELLPILTSWKQDGTDGHNFQRGPPKIHFSKVWLKLAQQFQRRRNFCQCRPVSKMAAMTKNRNFFKWPKLLYFKPESAQI